MKELKEILKSYSYLKSSNKKSALATVVHIEGSSYRRPGARMLIAEDGRLTGAISGGCLEGDAMRKALQVINNQIPALVTYDTMDEDDATFGIGLGCNGIIQVLIEPINNEENINAIHILQKAVDNRQNSVAVTLFSFNDKKLPFAGTKLIFNENGEFHHDIKDQELFLLCKTQATEVLNEAKSKWVEINYNNQDITIFYEYLTPAINLIVVGAGNDVMPLLNMAEILGWDTNVIDGRPSHAKQERFSSSCQVILSKPEQILDKINVDAKTVFALMTHNYNYDKALLHFLCKNNIRYIAMLGPKKKLQRMLKEYNEEGKPLTEEELNCVYSPAGLDIGAETSEEIALSILAEIQSFMNGKFKYSLREKVEQIHT